MTRVGSQSHRKKKLHFVSSFRSLTEKTRREKEELLDYSREPNEDHRKHYIM